MPFLAFSQKMMPQQNHLYIINQVYTVKCVEAMELHSSKHTQKIKNAIVSSWLKAKLTSVVFGLNAAVKCSNKNMSSM